MTVPRVRSAPALLFPIIAGSVLAFLCFSLMPKNTAQQFEELALGRETTSFYATVGDYPIHCKKPRDGTACIQGVKVRAAGKLVLWLGNSQVHAVNQMKDGDENAPPILFKKLQKHDADLVVFSQPNANLQEHYVLFEYLVKRLDIRLLLLPLVFDDMRESGLRQEFREVTGELRDVLRSSDVGMQILNESKDSGGDDLAGLADTVQEKSERYLNDLLAENLGIWNERPALRGQFLTSLYKLRNFVFGITPETKRKMIKGRYELNRRALAQLLESARNKGIQVIAYIVPLRSDVDIPYVQVEYDAYKEDMNRLVSSAGQVILNHENLVPGRYWGRKEATTIGGEAELDFMHFQAPGHALLADELYESIREHLQ